MILNRSSIPIKYTVVAAVTFALSDQIVISLSPAPHPHFDPSCVCDLPFPLLRTSPFLPIPMHHLSICVFHRFSSFFIVFHRFSSFFIVFHRVSSFFIVFHRFSSFFIVFHRFSSFFIVFHRFSSFFIVFIVFHRFSSFFRFLPKWQACKIHHVQVFLRASRAGCSVQRLATSFCSSHFSVSPAAQLLSWPPCGTWWDYGTGHRTPPIGTIGCTQASKRLKAGKSSSSSKPASNASRMASSQSTD